MTIFGELFNGCKCLGPLLDADSVHFINEYEQTLFEEHSDEGVEERAEVDVIDAIHMGECGLHVLEDVDEIVLIEVSELEVSQNDAEPLLDELEETG